MSLNADMNLTQRHRGTEGFLREGENLLVMHFKHLGTSSVSLCLCV